LKAAFDIDFAALLHVFADDLSEALPGNDVVPFGAVLPLAGLVFVALVGSQ
jgi:hypothetical protein